MRHKVDFSSLFRTSPYACAVLTPDRLIVEINPAYLDLLGKSREQIVGRNILDSLPTLAEPVRAATLARYQAAFDSAVQHATRAFDVIQLPLSAADPRVKSVEGHWHVTNVPLLDDAGRVAHVAQHVLIVPQQPAIAAEHAPAWRTEVDRMRRVFEHAPLLVALLQGPRHVCVFLNAAGREWLGPRGIIGLPLAEAIPELQRQNYVQMLDRVRISGVPEAGKDMRVALDGGAHGSAERFLDLLIQPIATPGGRVSAILLMGHDVTAYHRTRDNLARYRDRLEELVEQRTRALRASESERQRAQEALLQSRKMEAVGKLTGGVAHDFNNLLQIIGGNLQLLRHDDLGQVANRRLQVAVAALARGRKLTEQLLTFARKQPLAPVAIDLADFFEGMRELLLHAVGEQIRLEVILAPGLWRCHADPHHLSNVLLNLVINGRDAIDGEGTVTIRAANITLTAAEVETAAGGLDHPGPYVGIVVSDTGRGMSADVKEQAFEPFFTTKEAGRGTGLGLSMAYGFISQSRGGIRIDSELGKGTAICLYLPRAGAEEAVAEVGDEVATVAAEGRATILVVEDDPAVRATAVDLLIDLGYCVLAAASADAALEMLRQDPAIHLIFTDVIMPGTLSSTDLARRAVEISPDIEILFTSGYCPSHAGYPEGIRQEVLSKPHDQGVLSHRIRHALRNREQRLLLRRSTGSMHPAGAACGSLHILLVEDQDDTRETCAELLGILGHEVVKVASGEDAMDRLAHSRFDVLCTDIGLPGMSGIELAQRARDLYPRLPIVFASGYGASGHDAVADPVPIVVAKPYGLNNLGQALEQAVARAAEATTPSEEGVGKSEAE